MHALVKIRKAVLRPGMLDGLKKVILPRNDFQKNSGKSRTIIFQHSF